MGISKVFRQIIQMNDYFEDPMREVERENLNAENLNEELTNQGNE